MEVWAFQWCRCTVRVFASSEADNHQRWEESKWTAPFPYRKLPWCTNVTTTAIFQQSLQNKNMLARKQQQPSPNWCLLIWSQISEHDSDKAQTASERENNEGGRRTDVRHGVAPHRKPVLPCHTLERYFRKSVRFLASCGGTGQSGEGRPGNTVAQSIAAA